MAANTTTTITTLITNAIHGSTAKASAARSVDEPPGYGDVNTFLRIIFVFLARIGFLLIQLGSIPVENVYRIVFLNIFEIGNAIVCYILCGYMITFGQKTFKGFFGFSSDYSPSIDRLDDGIMGISAVLLGTAQISCFLIGRVHVITSILTTLLYCAIFQPLLGHWIWNEEGWMKKFEIAKTKVSVKDYGGSLVIHLSSSLIGAIGAMFLGRRLIKLKLLDERSISREYSGSTLAGYVFVILGYAAFHLPSQGYIAVKKPFNCIAIMLINMAAAFATGVIITSLLTTCILKRMFNYWSVLRCVQGGIAGIISITAAVDIYSFVESISIATISSLLFFLFSILIHNTSLEDNCNIIASHFVSSILGTIACPIIASKENFEGNVRMVHILWQLICLLVVMGYCMVFSWLIFLCFTVCGIMRSKEEVANHRRARNVAKYLPKKGCLQRLFMIDGKTDHIAPGESIRRKYYQDDASNLQEKGKKIQGTKAVFIEGVK